MSIHAVFPPSEPANLPSHLGLEAVWFAFPGFQQCDTKSTKVTHYLSPALTRLVLALFSLLMV